jgi:hypothetical protein
MPTRLSRKKLDEAEPLTSLAPRIAAQRIGQEPPKPETPPVREKNPAAVALGRLGASKGGTARAAALSSPQKAAIAKKAAMARWGKSRDHPPR